LRVIVCGGRDFNNTAFIFSHLDRLNAERPFTALMHGGAKGADSIAAEWAMTKPRIVRYVCLANWEEHGKAAGPRRNARMMEWEPDLVVAFPGGRGTADMVRRAKAAGVEVVNVPSNV
jgi:predicted Rossmann-fold nucleotide-binding protein